MSDMWILALLGSLAVVLFGCVAVFYALWDRAIIRTARAVESFTKPSTPAHAIDSGWTIRREVAWLLDMPVSALLARRDIEPQGHPCGVVVVLRSDCDPAMRQTARDVEGAVRANLAVGVTFAIVTRARVNGEQGRASTRTA